MTIALTGTTPSLPAPDPWVTAQRAGLTDLRADVAASKPDLSGATWAKLTGAGVAGIGLGFAAGMATTKFSGNMGLGGAVLTMMGGMLVGGVAGAVGGGVLGSYLTRPRGLDADAIRGAHQIDVENHLRIIDAELSALDAANADTPHI
jgi:hypothetical protein